ncbi:MAG TPA: hypothetical protein PKE47_07165 [Verrucomicrobiota bacterium]|nr:hypothetical protein [Verrucomicrobiota bacterium]
MAVAVATAGRVLVAVGVTVEVGVAVCAGVAVFVGVGVAVGVLVAVLVGIGSGVAVLVGVKVAVGGGTGVAARNWKFARADELPTRHTADTLIVTVCPGEPVTVNVPARFPPVVEPEPDACPPGTDETLTVPPLHQPLPESSPLAAGAGPDGGVSTSVATWALAGVARPGLAWLGGIETASSAATTRTLTTGTRFIARLRSRPAQCGPVQHHRDPPRPPRSSARPAVRLRPTRRRPG